MIHHHQQWARARDAIVARGLQRPYELREYLERSSGQPTRGEGVVILQHAGRDLAGTRARYSPQRIDETCGGTLEVWSSAARRPRASEAASSFAQKCM